MRTQVPNSTAFVPAFLGPGLDNSAQSIRIGIGSGAMGGLAHCSLRPEAATATEGDRRSEGLAFMIDPVGASPQCNLRPSTS